MERISSQQRLQQRLIIVRYILFWEQILARGWAVTAALLFFFAVSFSGVMPLLPRFLHIALLTGAAGFVFATLIWGVGGLRIPSQNAARKRLEDHNGLHHAPIASLMDRHIPDQGPVTAQLWLSHMQRSLSQIAHMRLPAPRQMLSSHDRYALLPACVMLFVFAGLIGWGDWGPRLAQAMSPFAERQTGEASLWLSPPDYTRAAPVALPVGQTDTPLQTETPPIFTVPDGSRLVGTITTAGTPELSIDGTAIPLEAVTGGYRVDAPIPRAGEITLQMQRIEAWQVRLRQDTAPVVRFTTQPTKRNHLQLSHEAVDDYGLVKLTLIIHPRAEVLRGQTPLEQAIALGEEMPRSSTGTDFHDLTPHRWAGQKVGLFLQAEDALGQIGRSDVVELILPERTFTHPVANLLIGQRKHLLNKTKPERDIALNLDQISQNPGAFDHRIAVFLGLRIASSRLSDQVSSPQRLEIADLLWDMAGAIEQGDLFLAQKQLHQAQQALAQALEDSDINAGQLDSLLEQFNQALRQYLQLMAERGAQDPQEVSSFMNRLESTDLNRMIAQMRALSRAGARDSARQVLAQMRSLLENMRIIKPGQERQNATMHARDPLGRATGNNATIDMPDTEDLDRAWRTMQELHRRAADPDRPELELQYLDRLLERF